MWVIWHMIAHPCRCTRAENSRSTGTIESSPIQIWPNADGESGAMLDEPPNMVRASPPFAFSSW